MDSILELHTLEKRYQQYGKTLVSEKVISNSSLKILEVLFYKGLIARGEVQSICRVKRRRATEIIKELLSNHLVRSESAHGDLSIYFTANPFLFPKLE